MATYSDGKTEAMEGDVVEVVCSPWNNVSSGDRATINAPANGELLQAMIHSNKDPVWWRSDRFKLISRAPSPAKAEPLVDLVNHPPHYAGLSPEPVDVIEAWQLEWHEGNAMKYIARAKNKGERIQDLRKAAWYLTRKAEMLEKNSI